MKIKRIAASLCSLFFLSSNSTGSAASSPVVGDNVSSKSQSVSKNIVMQAMEKELARSYAKLKSAGPAPVHFLAYRIYDEQKLTLTSSCGGWEGSPETEHTRLLNVEIRAGSPQIDSTHRSRNFGANWRESATLPLDDDENALRAVIWNQTDTAFTSVF